jgi:hypothetical protein
MEMHPSSSHEIARLQHQERLRRAPNAQMAAELGARQSTPPRDRLAVLRSLIQLSPRRPFARPSASAETTPPPAQP